MASSKEFDVVIDKSIDESVAVHGDAIARMLLWQGFCTIDAGIDDSTLQQCSENIGELKQQSKFFPPHHLVKMGLLGDAGSGLIAELDLDVSRNQGDGLQMVDEAMDRCALELSAVVDVLGFDFSHRTATVVHCPVPESEIDDSTVLDEETVTKWLTIFSKHKVMMLTFLGTEGGSLELKPYWDFEADKFDLEVKPGMVVFLRPDTLSHKFHAASASGKADAYVATAFLLMGRPQKKHGSCCRLIEPALELEQIMNKKMQKIKDDWTEDSLWDPKVPRQWQSMMNHQWYKADGSIIAVRGIGGRFTASWDVDTWYVGFTMCADYGAEVPYERWDHKSVYDADPESWNNMKAYCKHGCFMEGVDLFDPRIFGISPSEAKTIDPNQRMIMETGYDSLCRSGYQKNQLMNLLAGVYAGYGTTEWDFTESEKDYGAFGATGVAAAIVSNRLSFCLGMKGPSMTIDTEGASSMTALYMGVEGVMRKGRGHATEISIACGVHLMLASIWWPQDCAAGRMAKEGRCFSFNATADGFIRADSCVSCVLKPLLDREDDGSPANITDEEEPFIGLVASCVMNHNGFGASLTAASGQSHQEVVVDAIRDAQIAPQDVDAVEANSPARFMDDAIEVLAHLRAHRAVGDLEPLTIAPMRSNCGYSVEASGLGAFVRALISGDRGSIVPQPHLNQLNPYVSEHDGTHLTLLTEIVEFERLSSYTGTLSRGFGGTNVYALCFGQVDEIRQPDSAEPRDAVFTHWPGGGGNQMKAKSYHLRGSFNKWDESEPMTPEPDGSYSFVMTIGEAGFEEFQILHNDRPEHVLHPDWYFSGKDTAAAGPDPCDGEDGGLNWCIEARGERLEGWFKRADMIKESEILDWSTDEHGNEIVKQEFWEATPDSGNPGDKYKILLLLNGKWRSVTWYKLEE